MVNVLKGLNRIIALALMFWCAGAGCMMVSYARASEAIDQAMSGSMSMDAHACCKAKHRALNKTQAPKSAANSQDAELSLLTVPTTPTQSGVMNCCPLTSGSIVVVSRSQSNDRATVLQQADSSSLLLLKSDPLPPTIPLRLPNRARAYLLDCAFLI